MKVYDENNILSGVYCNCCGLKIPHRGNVIISGALSFRAEWGFFSNKDGESHSFELCESCYDKIVRKFHLPVEISERTEFV